MHVCLFVPHVSVLIVDIVQSDVTQSLAWLLSLADNDRSCTSSLPRNGFILGHGNVLTNAAERSNRVIEFLGCVDALAQWQRVRVVKHLHLRLACLALVDGADARVLLVEPTALHVSLLLWVVLLRVDLADQVGDLLDTLLLA